MNEPAVVFENVTKKFGALEALRNFSLSVPRGSVLGLLGRNGAGKTTALRCLVGLQRPTGGLVRVLGRDPWDLDVPTRRQVGYVSERPLPFPWARVNDVIALCAPLYPKWDHRLEIQLLERFQVDRAAKLSALSLGRQRAIALLLALCPRPELVIMDEPAANLDPVSRREFLEQVLAVAAEEGRTVVFSSHIMSDVERVANRIAVIHHGRLRLDRDLDDVREKVRRVRIIFQSAAVLPAGWEIPGTIRVRRTDREILATIEDFSPETEAHLGSIVGAHVDVQPVGLEDLFLDLVGNESSDLAA